MLVIANTNCGVDIQMVTDLLYFVDENVFNYLRRKLVKCIPLLPASPPQLYSPKVNCECPVVSLGTDVERILDALAKPSQTLLHSPRDTFCSSCVSALLPWVGSDGELPFNLAFSEEGSTLKSFCPTFGYTCEFGV